MPIPAKKLLCLMILTMFVTGVVMAQKSTMKGSMACSIRKGNMELQWILIQNVKSLKLPVKNASAKLPLKYSVYNINNTVLKKYLMELKTTPGNIVLPMPAATGCSEFSVINSGTMSAELAAKFPQIVSLKGTDVKEKTTSLRLDYNGTELNAEINMAGVPYIIAPWKKGKIIYYLLYKKEDSGVARKPLSE